jgi:serine/threonine-protein phosphatase PP1 catalytic subunit
MFTDMFNWMPITALIDDKVFCMHGGLSPDLIKIDQLRRIVRPTDVPCEGLVCDILWSDPSTEVERWGENDRGVSHIFSHVIVKEFCEENGVELIVRAHQVLINA